MKEVGNLLVHFRCVSRWVSEIIFMVRFFLFHRCWCAGRRCGPTMSTRHPACGRAAARPRRGPTLLATSPTRPGVRLLAAPIPGECWRRRRERNRDALSKTESKSYKNIIYMIYISGSSVCCVQNQNTGPLAVNARSGEKKKIKSEWQIIALVE